MSGSSLELANIQLNNLEGESIQNVFTCITEWIEEGIDAYFSDEKKDLSDKDISEIRDLIEGCLKYYGFEKIIEDIKTTPKDNIFNKVNEGY